MTEQETIKSLEILCRTTEALEKAEKQGETLERIVIKTIEILASEIRKGGSY